MLEGQFISRLILIAFFGIVYIYTMTRMASSDSIEATPQKHTVLKIVGSIILLSGVVDLIWGIYLLSQIQYPEQTIDFSFTPYQNVRPTDVSIVWGYTTSEQNLAIISLTNIFSSLAVASYCFLYRKSNRKWYKRIFRFFYGLLMYAFYCSATDFHYFDANEMIVPGLFCLMTGYEIYRIIYRKKQQAEKLRMVAISSMLNQKFAKENKSREYDNRFMPYHDDSMENNSKEDESRFMPHKDDDMKSKSKEDDCRFMPYQDAGMDSSPKTSSENEEESTTDFPDRFTCCDEEHIEVQEATNNDNNLPKYCRHCGKEVDYANSRYCKYCGRELKS